MAMTAHVTETARMTTTAKTPETFYRQEDAFRACDWLNGQRTWACDVDVTGKKRFLVADRAHMHAYNATRKPEDRNFYECLTDPDALPDPTLGRCRLFFDLDMPRANLPEGVPHMRTVTDHIGAFVRETCPMVATVRFLSLTAHSDAKFSQHLIAHCFTADGDEILFRSVKDVGALVRRWELRARTDQIPVYAAQKCLVDPDVYTSNRYFRTVGSTKRGQARPLRHAVTGVDVSLTAWLNLLVQCDNTLDTDLAIAEIDGGPAKSTRNFYDSEQQTRKRRAPSLSVNTPSVGASASKRPRLHAKGGTVAALVATYISKRVNATATVVSHNATTLVIRTLSRHCDIAGREHASNNVYFTVSSDGRAYQKCQDGACEGRRHEVELPHGLKIQLMRAKQLEAILNGT